MHHTTLIYEHILELSQMIYVYDLHWITALKIVYMS